MARNSIKMVHERNMILTPSLLCIAWMVLKRQKLVNSMYGPFCRSRNWESLHTWSISFRENAEVDKIFTEFTWCYVIKSCVTALKWQFKVVVDEMADGSNDSVKSEVLETRKQLEELDKNYRNLKGLSQRGKGCIVLRGISRRTRVADKCD